ncbi:MAG: hypothetical protein FD150_1509 [Rhodobacteraceae bacterium]|nr:MAG: hypothetical protein FD150_1509 [Paracoccaceae bacterium]
MPEVRAIKHLALNCCCLLERLCRKNSGRTFRLSRRMRTVQGPVSTATRRPSRLGPGEPDASCKPFPSCQIKLIFGKRMFLAVESTSASSSERTHRTPSVIRSVDVRACPGPPCHGRPSAQHRREAGGRDRERYRHAGASATGNGAAAHAAGPSCVAVPEHPAERTEQLCERRSSASPAGVRWCLDRTMKTW